LGYAQYLPKEQFLYQTDQLEDDMCMALGGRAAEEIMFGKISTGALSDLERVTKVAYNIVSIYGMNDKIGHVSFYDPKKSEYSFGKPYSEDTAKIIDTEVKLIVENAYQRTKNLLLQHKHHLEALAQELLKREIIYQSDLEKIIGKRPFEAPTSYESFVNSDNGKKEDEDKTDEVTSAQIKDDAKSSSPEVPPTVAPSASDTDNPDVEPKKPAA
jgi:cell division protease FtsH